MERSDNFYNVRVEDELIISFGAKRHYIKCLSRRRVKYIIWSEATYSKLFERSEYFDSEGSRATVNN